MAEVLSRFNVKLSINALKTNAGDLSTATDPLLVNWTQEFTNGNSTAGQANQFWSDTRTITATTADNLDLAGVLVSSLGVGATITFTKINGIFIQHNTPAASAPMQVGGHATLALLTMFKSTVDLDTDQPSLYVRPGGFLALVAPDSAGYIVGTEDMLRIYNGGAGSISYNVVIVGCVA